MAFALNGAAIDVPYADMKIVSNMDGFFYYVDDVRNCKANDDKGCKNYDGVSEECNGRSAQH